MGSGSLSGLSCIITARDQIYVIRHIILRRYISNFFAVRFTGSIDLISIFSGSREVYKPYNETEYDQKEDTEEKKFLSAHLAYTEKVALFFG